MTPAALDTITVLMTPRGQLATKRWVRTKSKTTLIGYSKASKFTSYLLPVSSIYELSAILSCVLEPQPQAFVIRGQPLNHVILDVLHLRRKVNYMTPSEGRRWVMIDLDKIKVPAKLRSPAMQAQLRRYLVGLLPSEFHDASYHWQLSAKAGMLRSNAVSMHLWFWLDQPVPDADLRAWAKWIKDLKGFKLIDWALFADVQPHYTAAPVFEGLKDPISRRSGLQRGKKDSVKIVLPDGKSPKVMKNASNFVARRSGGRASKRSSGVTGFEAHLAQIGDHPGGDGFHNAILSATASYVSANIMDEAEIEKLYRVVSQAVLAADASNHDEHYVTNKASREVIVPMIRDAIKKFSKTPPAYRKGRLHVGILPSFSGPKMTVAQASLRLQNLIADFFK